MWPGPHTVTEQVLARNTLDVSLLQPGDILMVANPTDMPLIRYAIFWSHVGIVSARGTVIDAVREPRGEGQDRQTWFQVQEAPLSAYLLAYDILAVRPRLPAEARLAAARYAASKLGAPYAPTVQRILLGRRDTAAYSCASLMWQAYQEQGLDLAPAPALCRNLNVMPLWLARDPQVEAVASGTRYVHLSSRRSSAQRWWFRRVLCAWPSPAAAGVL